ncbi:MAG TPA: hypothetical protein VFB82_20015 [Blastocatellia bacterium]|nr:hypothetical protein [Blastocatellia bacterium]
MNAKTRTLMILPAVTLCLGLFPFHQSASAQSARGWFGPRTPAPWALAQTANNSNCRALKGKGVQVFDPVLGVVSGPVTNAGILNGTLEDVINFAAGFIFTPDPTVISYTTDLTITTNHGQLRASPVTTQSVITGAGAEWGAINPNTSTGRFAGATGMIFITFKPVGDPSVGPYEAVIAGEICLADEQ